MARLTYLTPLIVGVLALTGCPGDDSTPQESDTEGATGSTGSPTTTPMTMTTMDPDTSTGAVDDTTTSGGDVCDPACAAGECCVAGLCFDEPADPTCPGGCAEGEVCVWPEGADHCSSEGECVVVEACDYPAGNYDQCINDMGEADETFCAAGSTCVTGPDNESACSFQGCEPPAPGQEVCTCPEPPATGDAPVVCADVTNDMVNDCYLSCENDETCPSGMSCFGGFVCVWPIPQPQAGYKNCSLSGFMCQAGEDCLQEMGAPPAWAVCSQPGCTTEMDCTFPGPVTGDAPVTCGDPTGGMGMPGDRCYLDCSMGQTCPDGMSCRNDSWCAWDAGNTLFFDDFQTADFSGGMYATGPWTVSDEDMQVPADPVSFINDAWIVSDAFDGGAGSNLAAYSNSWYNPAGQADDWLISAQIMLGPNSRVEWFARAQDPAYPDGYMVYVSTTGNTVADFTDPPIFSIPEEGATGDYVYHSVDLAAAGYADQNVYLAWRNNSVDEFVLLVDDVAVVDMP